MSMKRRASNTSLQIAESESDEEAFLYDDDPFSSKNNNTTVSTEPQLIVEKFMGRKLLKTEDDKVEEMFLVKWKGLSYLHASWERKDDLDQVDPNAKLKLKRFLQTPQLPGILGELSNKDDTKEEEDMESGPADEDEIQYFSPDMIEVQRVISCDTPTVFHAKARKPSDLLKGKGSSSRKRKSASLDSSDEEDDSANDVKYLVKWTGLSYDECSWERWEDIKPFYREVWLFWQIQKPPKLPIVPPAFPSLQEYRKLEKSPIFGVSNILIDEDETSSNGLRLRDYQLEGVNWLLWNWWHKRPCILADEMGLGKTIQTVTFLHQLRYMKTTSINGPFLVIAPLSLVDQWLSEIQTWSPDMNTILLHGNAEARETIINNEFYYQEPFVSRQDSTSLKKSNVCKFHILLTTFEVAVKEIRVLTRVPWQVMIIDEAHKLKNTSSRLFTTLSTINCQHCVLLTGTPLQNKTEELWALLNFADPKRFNDMNDFLLKFGDLKNASQVAKLHEMLKPYLLRRIKEDVEKSLPPKEETIVEVALTAVQKRFYRAIFEKNTQYLFRGLKASNQPSLMNVMMELRKCCNHPFLVRGVEERVFTDLTPEERQDEQIVHKKLIECSGKLVLLDKLLPRLFAEGHKVLIFSQMVKVLNLLEDFLKYKGYSFERLDGSSKSSDRKDAVDRFCKPAMNKFIMLLSTKAGGLGLNLTAADTVIIYDSDWNPQNDLQAQARAHRIGQTKAVMVYRLLTRKTYEMEMFHQASMKLGLDRAVLAHARNEQEEKHHKQNQGPVDNASKLNLKEIDELLKRGAYDVFREDDTEQNEFVEADIDAILQRRAHKVTYDDGMSSITSTLGNFSKASFVSADEKEDVDINDPDFWKKAIGLKDENGGLLHEPDEIELLPSQRVRKQTKVYGDLHDIDEDQIKEFLKPLKSDKPDKTGKDKDVSKETLLKEKREREEARRQKALEEARVKGDPKNWGSHGRDRVLRSLNTYGYGRWERIKTETGKVAMDTKDLEGFSRAYVLQCGLIASEMEPHKSDTAYVHEAIVAAKELEAQVKAGKKTYDIPPSLSEDKFIAKLKTGLAKKTLNKLDTLSKLIQMMQETIEKAYQEKQLAYDPTMDMDVAYTALSLQDIENHLPLGDVRPTWARTCVWWNIDCDKHLLIGIFKHGFGRYDLIREDETLLFKNKLAQLNQEAGKSSNNASGMGGDGNNGEGGEESMKSGPSSSTNSATAGGATASATVMETEGDDQEDASDKEGDDLDEEGGGKDPSKLSAQYSSCMPDPRHLNRLINFLVTSEMARMSKAEYAEKSKSEKKARNSEVFTIKKTAFLTNQPMDGEGEDAAGEMMTKNLFQALRDSLDTESIQLVYKGQIQGLKKCEQILSVPPTPPPPSSSSTNGEDTTTAAMDVDGQEITSEGTSSGGVKPLIIHELDAIRLSAAFILYGVPIEGVETLPVFENYKRYLGIKKPAGTNTNVNNGNNNNNTTEAYNWKRFKEYSKVPFSEEEIHYYYKTTWLPFCEQIYYRKALSYSQQKYLVPNPLLSPMDHHYASRGLCQVFAMRQQLLYSTYFVVTQCTEALLDYLRSPTGRNVDNMPVWWCPWIHDLGILLGLLKYGYLALEPIFQDEELPFTTDYLDIFVKKVFLFGENGVLPVGRVDITTKEEAEAFVKIALWQYPEQRDIELRVIRILEELTKQLPADHHCKLIVTTSLFRVFTMHNNPTTNNNNTTTSTLGGGGGGGGSGVGEGEGGSEVANGVTGNGCGGGSAAAGGAAGGEKKIDLRTNRSTARIPAVSLKTFIAMSRKRRKLYVASYHPEFFPDVNHHQ